MIGILYLGAELNFPGCRIMINFNGEYWASQKYVLALELLRNAGIRVDIKLALERLHNEISIIY